MVRISKKEKRLRAKIKKLHGKEAVALVLHAVKKPIHLHISQECCQKIGKKPIQKEWVLTLHQGETHQQLGNM